MSGTLYVVATPIGNLKDISVRAIETLEAVDLIACEDTRQTSKLLQRYDIKKLLVSLHEYNERQRTPELLAKLKSGASVALVSDGGTPLISDPGWWLVRQAIDEGIVVQAIPGPCAAVTALVVSGLPTDRFAFEGFLPVKPGPRKRRLETLKNEERTAVLYESPHRLLKTLADIETVYGDVTMACCRELTKQFEETRRERVSAMRTHFTTHPPKGEFVIVVPPWRSRTNG